MSAVTEALANREFRGLVIAQVASEAGDQIARVALAFLVLDRTGSALGAAATFAVSYVPALFGGALLGPLADRLSRRTLMLGADLGRALVIGLLALAAAPTTPIALLLALLLVAEFMTPLFNAARDASIPSILGEPRLVGAGMGLARSLHLTNQVVGLFIGGLLVTFVDPRVGLAINALSFVASFIVLYLTLRTRDATMEGPGGLAVLMNDLRIGARDLWGDSARRALVLFAWGMAFVVIAPEALALAYARYVGLEDYWGGLLMAAPVAGAALGSVYITRIAPDGQLRYVIPLALASVVALLPTGLELPVPIVLVLWAIAGALQAFFVTLIVVTGLLTRDQYRGRVNGLAATGFGIASLAGTLFAGVLGDLSTPPYAVTIVAVAGLCIVGVARALWPTRDLGRAADTLH